MTFIRKGHGKGAGTPHVEVPPADELTAGVAAPTVTPAPRNKGKFTSESARQAGRLGGLAKARRDPMQAAKSLGLGRHLTQFPEDARITPFINAAERWMRQELEGLARDVGGGHLSAGVVSIVQGAAWKKCFAEFYFDLNTRAQFMWTVEEAKVMTAGERKMLLRANTDLVSTAARLAEGYRQDMLAAHALAKVEAEARKAARAHEPYDVSRALGLGDGKDPTT